MNETQREQIKLRATYVNNLAVGVFTAGALGPVIALATEEKAPTSSLSLSALVAIFCFVASFVIHLYAGKHLSELEK